jgi:glutathione S-transferase
MTEIIIHGVPGSPFTRSAMIVLEEKGLPYRFQPMAPQDSKSATHLTMHPFGRVPVMQHGDFVLYETQAILRYVDALAPTPALTPAAPRAAARMNQIIGINDWYFFPKAAAPIVFERIVGPLLLGLATNEEKVASGVPMARTCIAELERLRGAQRYLAGDDFSLADIMLAPQFGLLALTPEGAALLRGTRLAGWLADVEERPSFRATRPPEVLRGAA